MHSTSMHTMGERVTVKSIWSLLLELGSSSEWDMVNHWPEFSPTLSQSAPDVERALQTLRLDIQTIVDVILVYAGMIMVCTSSRFRSTC